MKKLLVTVIVIIILAAAGLLYYRGKHESATSLANPASEHCIAQGGQLEIRRGEDGEYGVCTLPTGEQCEEWALFRDKKCVIPK